MGSLIDYSRLKYYKMEENYKFLMQRCDVVVEHEVPSEMLTTYDFITEVDLNEDALVEAIVYSESKSTLFWMKQYEPFISGFGWNSQFWIYLIIYLYIVSSIVGIYEFLKLKRLNDEYVMEKSQDKFLKEEHERNVSCSDYNIELKI